MRISILLPFVPRRPEQILPFAALAAWTSAERLWQGQSPVLEPFHGFAYAAAAGFRVPTGISVALMPLRHPFDAAQLAQSAAMTSGQPVRIAFGPGAKDFQRALLGEPYASPLTASREYVNIVRGLVSGETVDVRGEYFSCHGSLHGVPTPTIEVGLGVLRPAMAALAGEVADQAVTWLTPPNYLTDVIAPAIADGARTARRTAPTITALVPVGLHRPGRDPRELALHSAFAHLQGPHYIDMLRRAGIVVSGKPTLDDAQKLIDGDVFIHGRPDDIARGLDGYRQAGVDELVLNLTGTCTVHGPRAALDDLKVLLTRLDLAALGGDPASEHGITDRHPVPAL